ncbi:MAG: hypothetical protein ACREA0_16095 [bacterium]
MAASTRPGSCAPRSVQIRATPSGVGYYVVNADGGVFAFGYARFFGAAPGQNERNPVADDALQTRRSTQDP